MPLHRMVWLLGLLLSLGGCGTDTGGSDVSNKPGNAATAPAISPGELAVIGYYTGDGTDLARYDFNKLTHVIYSFVYLDGNQVSFVNGDDKGTQEGQNEKEAYTRLLALKAQYPHLNVLIALGGWGGCEHCSDVFSSEENRIAFADSVNTLLKDVGGDGIDLDWEYPAIEGHPGHPYKAEDREHFTALVKTLRETLGQDYLLSVAAGGFDAFLQKSLDWQAVTPLVNNINVMSYDLVNGFSTTTGHHTPIYSTDSQKQSTDNAVQFLLDAGVPAQKIVIGAAFYSRVWEGVAPDKDGRYQSGKHVPGLKYAELEQDYTTERGYQVAWDEDAQAAFAYHAGEQRYATFDNPHSVALKTRYAKEHQLGGVMFWELPGDTDDGDLVNAIFQEKSR
ncbi:glycoside hydrolase family 18 protein [Microbulbifer sp. CAU 1566]|uniref:glycoside hydrolase family 18 protein n=1 Tax=Microbulbifer sp. CAU 1566 TaxID=2933269 RepID=UPI002003D9CC|nr:glycoside hydrolase family 18 protein [Microbulbifer sp. CAU 1566]MCK7598251.1 glycoside hydrolase family 18 protein [Microbulbifer sp. CAU 1566]